MDLITFVVLFVFWFLSWQLVFKKRYFEPTIPLFSVILFLMLALRIGIPRFLPEALHIEIPFFKVAVCSGAIFLLLIKAIFHFKSVKN